MRLAGLQACTFQDYPGRMACIVFTQGCDLRCPYCHNPGTRPGHGGQNLSEVDVLEFLDKRRGKLGAVVVSGGEPCLQGDLAEFLRELKERGLAVKLDTNGTRPAVLANLLARKLVDYVAMDLKDLPQNYPGWLGDVPAMRLEASLGLLRESGVAHEFRTTVVAPHLDLGRLREMGRLVRGSRWLLQEARTGPGPKKDWTPVPKQVLCAWAQELRAAGIDAMARGEEQQG